MMEVRYKYKGGGYGQDYENLVAVRIGGEYRVFGFTIDGVRFTLAPPGKTKEAYSHFYDVKFSEEAVKHWKILKNDDPAWLRFEVLRDIPPEFRKKWGLEEEYEKAFREMRDDTKRSETESQL